MKIMVFVTAGEEMFRNHGEKISLREMGNIEKKKKPGKMSILLSSTFSSLKKINQGRLLHTNGGKEGIIMMALEETR